MTAVSDETGRDAILAEQWDILVHKDDRTSPEEYPDHCLITMEEVGDIIDATLSASPVAQEPVAYQYRACIAGKWGDWTDLHQSVEGFRNGPWKSRLENGTCELRALYAGTPPATPAGTPANRGDRVIYWLKRYQADEHLDDDACEELDALINVLSKGVKVQPSAGVGARNASIVTCCVTGAIPGDGGACGDCDPCTQGEALVPEAVKRLIAEKNSLIFRIGELEDAAQAGVGADEIRLACIEHASLNMTPEAAHRQADRITAAILALLSRAGDQK